MLFIDLVLQRKQKMVMNSIFKYVYIYYSVYFFPKQRLLVYVLVLCLQVNHLGHFLLTLDLLPVLERSARETGDVRVVYVSSAAHNSANWEPDNMNGEREYSRLKFYPKSKLYNVSVLIQWHHQHLLLIYGVILISGVAYNPENQPLYFPHNIM